MNIDHLPKDELIKLNCKISERIRYLEEIETRNIMNKFYPHDIVSFRDRSGNLIEGKIVKVNKITVNVVTRDNRRWTVSPHYLQKIKDGRNIGPMASAAEKKSLQLVSPQS